MEHSESVIPIFLPGRWLPAIVFLAVKHSDGFHQLCWKDTYYFSPVLDCVGAQCSHRAVLAFGWEEEQHDLKKGFRNEILN